MAVRKKCKNCGCELVTKARVCPRCGKNLKNPFDWMLGTFLGIAIAFILYKVFIKELVLRWF